MEKVNIKPFLSGDRVYYVGKSNDLPKNTVLIVDDCFKSSCKCNDWIVTIKGYTGYTMQGTKYFAGLKGECNRCNTTHIITGVLVERGASFFRHAQELNAPLMTFTKVAEVEKEQVLILN